MDFSIIVAIGKNGVIGNGNKIPWKLPADMKHVKNITTGHTIVMGQATYESIGKPLPNRKNIVLTDVPLHELPNSGGIVACRSIEEVLRSCVFDGEVFIFGGESVYKQFMPMVSKIYLTYIDEEFDGDRFFPPLKNKEWSLLSIDKGTKDEKNIYDHYFLEFVRVGV